MHRVGMVIGIVPEKIAEYKALHADVWPCVLEIIAQCNIRNYSIFLHEAENRLFSYFEYVGADYDKDMAIMAADPETLRWWELCMPCQMALPSRQHGEHWSTIEEVFHFEGANPPS